MALTDRREFCSNLVRCGLVCLLGDLLATGDMLASGAPKDARAWVREQSELASKLREGKLSGPQWQDGVEELSKQIDLAELAGFVDFERLERTMKLDGESATKSRITLRHPDDSSRSLRFGAAVFGLEKGKAITPHGHRNMVSAHLLLKGEMHLRNYDRLSTEPSALRLRPTVDKVIRRGDCSTMSSERNNIHWFVARETTYTLDVVVDGLHEGDEPYVIDLVDVRGGEKLGNGEVRAPLISWAKSVELYGKQE